MQHLNQSHNPNLDVHGPEYLDSVRAHIIIAAVNNVLPFLPTEHHRPVQEVAQVPVRPQSVAQIEPTIAPVLSIESARSNVANTLIIAEMEQQRQQNAA
jgi:hypothetical protein